MLTGEHMTEEEVAECFAALLGLNEDIDEDEQEERGGCSEQFTNLARIFSRLGIPADFFLLSRWRIFTGLCDPRGDLCGDVYRLYLGLPALSWAERQILSCRVTWAMWCMLIREKLWWQASCPEWHLCVLDIWLIITNVKLDPRVQLYKCILLWKKRCVNDMFG